MSKVKQVVSIPGIPLLVVLAIVFGLFAGLPNAGGPVTTRDGSLGGELGEDGGAGASSTTGPDASAAAAGGPAGGAGTAAQRAAAAAAGEKLGQGVLTDRIKIGYLVPDRDWDGVFAALGAPSGGVGFGNQRAMIEAAVADVNATGGMGGRRVEPYYFTYSFNRTIGDANAAAQSQQACTYWAQDSKVFAVLQVGFENWTIMNCLTERKVLLANTSTFVSAAHYQKIADYYGNLTFNSLDRQAADYVYGLQKMGFFTSRTGWGASSKIGLLYVDQSVAPDYPEAVKSGLEVELAKYGLKVGERAAVATTSNWTNLVVQFKNAGVTHVLFFVSSPLHYSLFMQAAQQQEPPGSSGSFWYGISTPAAPGILLQYTAPPEQLIKAIGPGWSPIADVAPADNPYPPTESDRRCLAVMARAGLATNDPLARGLQLATCIMNWFYQEGLDKARPNLTVQGVAASIAAGGSNFFPMRGVAMPFRFGPDRVNDGAAHFRPLSFSGPCECYKYEGEIQPMP